jgi:LDH2 family malate/lactate/ureidoglycolate dehydrogenase
MGIAGWFAERAARRGMLAVVGTNAVPQVAPIGTGEPMFGTDALSYAVPTGRGIICYDGALSVVSRGKLEQLGRLNERMRPGWAIDPSGREVTDPAEAVAGLIARKGYALLPLGGADQEQGGHKGSGLALLVELICGPLAGARWSNHTYEGGEAGLGHFALCIDLKALGDTNVVFESISDMALELRGAQPRDGKTTVRVPGDRRHALTEQRLSTGIPLLESVIEDLHSIAAEIRIEPLEFLVTKEIGGDNRR